MSSKTSRRIVKLVEKLLVEMRIFLEKDVSKRLQKKIINTIEEVNLLKAYKPLQFFWPNVSL